MKLLKSITLSVLFLVAVFTTAFSQQNMGKDSANARKKIKALYVAYITQELSLTETEAQQFWPVHMGYENEIKSIIEKKLPELDREEAILAVKKKYKDRFTKVLGAERTENFYKKDKEFRGKLIERMREHRKERGGPPPPRGRRHGMAPPPPPED
jgi:hypothetical protein